jgi:hypothetical protein
MAIGVRTYEEVLALLEKERDEAQNDLIKEREMNVSMWQTYGSELCAGDMEREERELKEKVDRIKTKIAILKDEHKDSSYRQNLDEKILYLKKDVVELKKGVLEKEEEIKQLQIEQDLLREVIHLFVK